MDNLLQAVKGKSLDAVKDALMASKHAGSITDVDVVAAYLLQQAGA